MIRSNTGGKQGYSPFTFKVTSVSFFFFFSLVQEIGSHLLKSVLKQHSYAHLYIGRVFHAPYWLQGNPLLKSPLLFLSVPAALLPLPHHSPEPGLACLPAHLFPLPLIMQCSTQTGQFHFIALVPSLSSLLFLPACPFFFLGKFVFICLPGLDSRLILAMITHKHLSILLSS